jgi:hypothetical protein
LLLYKNDLMALDSAMRLEFQIRFSSQQLHLIQQREGKKIFTSCFLRMLTSRELF